MDKTCENCKAMCCRYVGIEIDEPETKEDWDNIRWYLHHENIWVYMNEDGEWFIEFKTRCKNLLPNNKCGIYDSRPKICREHTQEECEFHNETSPYKILFKCVEDLEHYLKRKKSN